MVNEEEHKNVSFWFITTLVFTLLILSNSLVLLIGWLHSDDVKAWWQVGLLYDTVIDLVYATVFSKTIRATDYTNPIFVFIYNGILAFMLFLHGYLFYTAKIDWLAVNSGIVRLSVFQQIIRSDIIPLLMYGVFLFGVIMLWILRRRTPMNSKYL